MPAIIAYTYEAAAHCIDCARERFSFAKASCAEHCDENGLEIYALDANGNDVRPIFSTDETCADLPLDAGGCDLVCDTCRKTINAHYAKG